jgi:hypothetical protein
MVRKDDRGEGKFDTLTKALRLASYTIDITDNKKVFVPEHAKSTERIVYLARDIYHKARVANDIRVGDDKDLLMERRRLQNEAIAECDHLLSEIQIAKMIFHLRTKRVEYWGNMVEEVKGYLRKWRESDADRFRKRR